MSKAAVFTFREIINTNEELQDELRDGVSLIDLAAPKMSKARSKKCAAILKTRKSAGLKRQVRDDGYFLKGEV